MQEKISRAARGVAVGLTLALAGLPASAIEVGGIRFADRVQVGGADLIPNGGGVRTRFIFDVYAIVLYLPAKAASLDATNQRPRRITIHLLRDVKRADFVDALQAGLQANLGEAEFKALAPQLKLFVTQIGGEGEVKKGATVTLDDLPATGTRVAIGGQSLGRDIPGDKFYDALLRIWLGDSPVQADLKDKLLGK